MILYILWVSSCRTLLGFNCVAEQCLETNHYFLRLTCHSAAGDCRERSGDAVSRGQLRLHPGWLQLITSTGFVFYIHRYPPHVLTTTFYAAPVGGTCGGFLCDEMGLGKTLQSLMLVLTNPAPQGEYKAVPEAAGCCEGRCGCLLHDLGMFGCCLCLMSGIYAYCVVWHVP